MVGEGQVLDADHGIWNASSTLAMLDSDQQAKAKESAEHQFEIRRPG